MGLLMIEIEFVKTPLPQQVGAFCFAYYTANNCVDNYIANFQNNCGTYFESLQM